MRDLFPKVCSAPSRKSVVSVPFNRLSPILRIIFRHETKHFAAAYYDAVVVPYQKLARLFAEPADSDIMSSKKSFPLRLDPNIYSALEQWASEEIRSVNGHIEYLLRQALLKEKRIKKDGSLK